MTKKVPDKTLSKEVLQTLLRTDFLGFKLINPFVLASAPPTKDYATIRRGFEAGWAGAVTKSITLDPLCDKTPRIGILGKAKKPVALQNFEMGSCHSVKQWVEWVKQIKQEFPDRLLYVSLFASSNVDEWGELAEAFKGTPVDGFELNFSCPHSDHNGKGSLIAQNIDLCASITRTVKSIAGNEIRVMPKLPYLVHPNEALMCRSLTEAGADAFAAINTIAGLCEFDIYKMTPKLNVGGWTTGGGISYDLIRPFGRLIVSNIAQSVDWQKYPISAMGGVSRKTVSMVEYLILGANHLQVCSEVMKCGFEVVGKLENKLAGYLSETGTTLDKIRGAAIKNLKTWDQLDDQSRKAKLEPKLCKKCYRCVDRCLYGAIRYKKGRIPVFSPDVCEGCGNCLSYCPEKAISMEVV